jgi:hydrogenase maturation factor
MTFLPLGKLAPEIMMEIIRKSPILDPKVVMGPKFGVDCAIIDNGENYLVLKSDPITFTPQNIGWYAVQINVNDIVTTGALPKWMMATILLPENKTSKELIDSISDQLFGACQELGISFVGGHTEVTHGIDRPIISATLVGEVQKKDLITSAGTKVGDDLLLTKGIAIETTAILANDFENRLSQVLTPNEMAAAKNYIYQPGISVFKEARLAVQTGGIHAMHDPTEGGLSSALWEMAIAADKNILFFAENIIISDLTKKICTEFDLEPINSISSGALLMAVDPDFSQKIINVLAANGIRCSIIGSVLSEGANVCKAGENENTPLFRPERDEITKIYEI